MAKSRLLEHKALIEEMAASGITKQEAADRLGVPHSTLRSFILRQKIEWSKPAMTLPEAGAEVSREEVLEAELRDLRSKVKSVRSIDVAHERVLAEIREAVTAAEPRHTPPALDLALPEHPHVQALLLSDLHGGEVVDPEQVDYLNAYSWDICLRRMSEVKHSLLSFKKNRPYGIEELHLWLLGDMCSGSNHQEIAETNEFSAAEQGYQVGMMLGQWIEDLVPEYPSIVVHGVAGNHPRVPAKPQSKQVFNNFDWMSYKIAETYLTRYGSVRCHFPRAGHTVVETAGLNVLLFHGDGIRSTMPGVPWGGVMRRVRELRSQYAQMGIPLHGYALGHFHSANAVAGNIWMNGSLKGTDEYSLKQFGSGEPPEQLLVTFDPRKRRRTDVSYITPTEGIPNG